MELNLLGPPAVAYADGRRDPLPLGRPVRVLTALALQPGRVLEHDEIVAAVWDGTPPVTARNALHVYVSRLRAQLGARTIVTSGSGYRLTLPASSIDVLRFESEVHTAIADIRAGRIHIGVEALAAALPNYRGALLAGQTLSEALTAVRRRLAQTSEIAREELLGGRIVLAKPADAALLIGQARALVEQEPLSERRYVLLMDSLQLAGRTADALEAYTGARSVLHERAGLDPGDELRAARARILGTVEPGSSPDGPSLHSRLVGREREVDSVVALLHDRRLVTITGMSGSGKSRLAAEAVRLTQPYFAGRSRTVNLVDQSIAEDPLEAVARATGVPPESVVGELAEHLLQGRFLLVLESCEHLRMGPFIQDLLQALPGLSIVATSQRALGAAGEVVVCLTGLDAGTDDTVAVDLEHTSGVQLYLQRARESGHPVPTDQIPDVGRLVRRLSGLPLAIEMAASHPDGGRPNLLLERTALETIQFERWDDSGQLISLTDSIRRTLELLPEPSRQLLDLLSVLPLRAPDQLLLESANGSGPTAGHLHELVSWNLVTRPDAPVSQVEPLALVRELVMSQLDDAAVHSLHRRIRTGLSVLSADLLVRPLAVPASAEASDMVRALAAPAVGALAWPEPWSEPAEQTLTMLLLIDADVDQISLAAMASTLAQTAGNALPPDLRYDLQRARLGFALTGADKEGLAEVIADLAELASHADVTRQAAWAVDSVFLALEDGRLSEATSLADAAWDAVTSAKSDGDPLAVRAARARMHAVWLHRGAQDAVAHALQAAALADRIDSTESISAFGEAGGLLVSAGELDLGATYTRKAAQLALRWNSPHSLVYVLSLADLALEEGRISECRAITLVLLDRVWRRGDERYQKWCLIRLAQAAARSGDSKEAATLLGASSTVASGTAWESDPDVCDLLAQLPADLGGEAFREAFQQGASAPRGWVVASLTTHIDLPDTLEPELLVALRGN